MRRHALLLTTLCLALGCAACADLDSTIEAEERFPCTSDDDCIDGFRCGPSTVDPLLQVCQRFCEGHGDCAGRGVPSLCTRAGTCLDVDTDLCATIEGPIGTDDTVVIGALTPQGDYLDREQASVLAVREFNTAGGISGGRRLVMIGCDDGGDSAQAELAARHLAALGVPAIVGPYFSGVYIDTFGAVMRGAEIFTISPSATSPAITNLEDDGLAWRTISGDLVQSRGLVELVRLQSPTRIVVLAKDDAYGNYLLSEVSGPLIGEFTTENFTSISYDASGLDASGFVSGVFDADADVVLMAGTNEVALLLGAWEDQVRATGGTSPTYILTDGGKNDDVLAEIDARPGLEGSVTGTDPTLQNGGLYDSFAGRYLAEFGEPPATFAANAYDAVYVVAHALSASPGTRVTGRQIADNMNLLVAGTGVDVDPTGIGQARMSLAQGIAIDLEGTSGSLTFDLATGDADSGVTSWIVEPRQSGNLGFTTVGVFTPSGESGTWETVAVAP